MHPLHNRIISSQGYEPCGGQEDGGRQTGTFTPVSDTKLLKTRTVGHGEREGVHLDKGTNDTQTSQPKILKRPCLAAGVQEGVQEKRNVSCSHTNGQEIQRRVWKEPEPGIF